MEIRAHTIRDTVNRARVPVERAELQRQLDALPDGWTGTRRRWYLNAKLRDLDELERHMHLTDDHVDFELLSFDALSSKRVTLAICVGNPETAQHISIAIPGLGTTVQRSFGGLREECGHLHNVARKELLRAGRSDERVATIAWPGYVTPNLSGPLGVISQATGMWQLTTSPLARRAGPLLAQFIDQTRSAARLPDAHITILGHSYGSLVTAFALKKLDRDGNSRIVDDVIFYGSPGLASRPFPRRKTVPLDDLGVSAEHIYVMRAPEDRVASVGWFGGPLTASGATVLSTLPGTSPDGVYREGALGHADYPRLGDKHRVLRMSGYNMAVTVAGLPQWQVREPAPE